MTAGLQIIGAVLLLTGFVAAQLGAVRDTSLPYLVINMIGATSLAIVALLDRDWGFLLLEGSWAGISTAAVLRTVRRAHPPSSQPAPSPTNPAEPTTPQRSRPNPSDHNLRAPVRRHGRHRLPPTRAARLAGDELREPSRLIHLFRDTYAGSQGRQWLQPHILWWILTFLRQHGTAPDWNTLTSPTLARTITSLGLPPGHTTVEPPDQTAMNFGLWWSLLAELTQLAYRPRWSRRWPLRGHRLPDATQLDQRAAHLGLWPWMSSATFEEISGIARALARIHDHNRRHRADPDDFMIRILLPELLIAELHWLHIPGERPRTGHHAHVDVVLLRRYDKARTQWAQGHYLTPLDHMYLRAGDILHHLSSRPQESDDPVLRPIMDLYTQLRLDHDQTPTPTAHTTRS